MGQEQEAGDQVSDTEVVSSVECDDVTIDAVTSVVRKALDTMDGDISATDLKVIREIESISEYIQKSKRDVAAIRPDKISSEHIPEATDELDAIVTATEDATNSIMEAAELIEGVADKLEGDQAQILVDAVTSIYEACGFQDITGQRVGKIVTVMQNIEGKIAALVETFADEIEKLQADDPEQEVSENKDDADLLNGPQLEHDAQSQDEIDALLASFD
ncbi:MAG: protein phosphatase CheZ [Alphaproteobacteria bacterium]